MQSNLLSTCLLAVTAALLLSAASAQCPQQNWTQRAQSCYKWFSRPQYWFEAEQTCQSHGAHLASVGSEQENRLVGRLSHCRDAWIGKFGTDLNRLTDPRTYEWTDGSDALSFERHNFSQLDTVHKPLIRSDGEWWLNSLYHERHPFVCKASTNSSHHESSRRCPSGWSLKDDHCYLMPRFEANFNEANFYCQRNSSQLVSVLTHSELSFINEFTFGIDGCEKSPALDSVWLGLIKLNPCFPDSTGRELCYQWTDFSGKLASIPQWQAGHPNNADWTVNCVTLSAGRLRTDRCYNRHRFVCKSVASNDTDGGVTPPPVDGLVAAFDFRRSLDNLVDRRTYVIEDKFGVQRSTDLGAIFNESYAVYNVGAPTAYNESILSESEWSMYFKLRATAGHYPSLGFVNVSEKGGSYYSDTNLFAGLDYSYQDTEFKIVQYEPLDGIHMTVYHNGEVFRGRRPCLTSWCDVRISMKDNIYDWNLGFNGTLKSPRVETQPSYRSFGNQQIILGLTDAKWFSIDAIFMKCFGIALKQLSDTELQRAMSIYCPDA